MAGLQRKVIAKYISDRVNWWSYSIKNFECLKDVLDLQGVDKPTEDDEILIKSFQESVVDNTIVTGGCIASMLLGDEVNDLDIYFADKEVARKVAKYYLNTMIEAGSLKDTYKVSEMKIIDNNTDGVAVFIRSQGVTGDEVASSDEYRYFEMMDQNAVEGFLNDYLKTGAGKVKDKPKHSVSFMSSNAISLQNGIQLIFRFTGNAEEIHKNFDFVHCTNYWTMRTGVVYNPAALQALLEKRLSYIGSLFPVAAMFRLRKFISRGYRISAGEMTKIAFDISKLNLSDAFVLKEQLMGCDIAYFNEVISILNNESKRDFDRTYLISVIDRVFNDHDVEADTQDYG